MVDLGVSVISLGKGGASLGAAVSDGLGVLFSALAFGGGSVTTFFFQQFLLPGLIGSQHSGGQAS